MNVTFITGNPKKAHFLAKFLGVKIAHKNLDLDEVQSLDLKEIARHKAQQAYNILGSPVLVEDISFSVNALGKLPGPFIKWFIQEMDFEGLCRLADLSDDRKATTEVTYAYYDGSNIKFFEGKLEGTMPMHPRGDDGFGFNCVFIPDGQNKTNAEMNELEIEKYSLRTTTVYPKIRDFLQNIDSEA